MKRIILDYLRRKFWIVGFAALLELVMGGCAAFFDGHGYAGIESLQVQLGIFTGALLLSFDLQRGAARAVAMLPVTAREIGRAWWLATVALPVIVFSALLFSGAGLVCLFHANTHFPLRQLVFASLFLMSIMGSTFPVILAMNPQNFRSGWRMALNGLLGGVWGIMIGGSMWLFHDVPGHPVRFLSFVIFGLALTVLGWFRAEHLVAGRVNFRLGTQTGVGRKAGSAPAQIPRGFGGIPRLVSASFMMAFRMGLAMIVVLAFVHYLMGRDDGGWRRAIGGFESMGIFPFWFVIFFSLIPSFLQLRFLRTLPVSAATLAAAMLAAIVLPVLALGALSAGLIGLASGTPAALNVLNIYLLTLPPAALCPIFFAWRGTNTLSLLLMFLVMMSAQFVPIGLQMGLHYQQIPLSLEAALAVACILVSFWLTRLALIRSSHVYRPQSSVFAHAWNRG